MPAGRCPDVRFPDCARVDQVDTPTHDPLELGLEIEEIVEKILVLRDDVNQDVDIAPLWIESVGRHRAEHDEPLGDAGQLVTFDSVSLRGRRTGALT